MSGRAARGVAMAALTVACVVVGPAPGVVDAMERVFAVAVLEGRHPRDRIPGRRRSRGPASSRPLPSRP